MLKRGGLPALTSTLQWLHLLGLHSAKNLLSLSRWNSNLNIWLSWGLKNHARRWWVGEDYIQPCIYHNPLHVRHTSCSSIVVSGENVMPSCPCSLFKIKFMDPKKPKIKHTFYNLVGKCFGSCCYIKSFYSDFLPTQGRMTTTLSAVLFAQKKVIIPTVFIPKTGQQWS